MIPEAFVDIQALIPEIQTDIRYAAAHNLTGHPLAGYEAPRALLTRPAIEALQAAHRLAASLGYGMLVYDAYRPCRAVQDFVRWASLPEDGRTKAEFYPSLSKESLFPLGYIAHRSGHSRGSTVDLTLTIDGGPLEMGTCFDRMDPLSHHNAPGLSQLQRHNRALLRGIMAYAGFEPYEAEWWHYRLMDEHYPDTYFDFSIPTIHP